MWSAPLSIPKVLFFATRYGALLNTAFAATCKFGCRPLKHFESNHTHNTDGLPTDLSSKQCKSAFLTLGGPSRSLLSSFALIPITSNDESDDEAPRYCIRRYLSEVVSLSLNSILNTFLAILTIRVYAFSGKDRRLLAFLIPEFFVSFHLLDSKASIVRNNSVYDLGHPHLSAARVPQISSNRPM